MEPRYLHLRVKRIHFPIPRSSQFKQLGITVDSLYKDTAETKNMYSHSELSLYEWGHVGHWYPHSEYILISNVLIARVYRTGIQQR